MEALKFMRGNYYILTNLESRQALRVQGNQVSQFKNSRVVSTQPNPNDVGQLFMIEKVNLAQDSFEIVNCYANMVFDEEGGQIHLRPGKQSKDQLFFVQAAPSVQGLNNLFWIKCSADGQRAVSLQGILRYKNFDPNDPSQLFNIQQINSCNVLDQSCLLINNNSGKALDVPGGDFEPGLRLVQFQRNHRFNQRWIFVHHGHGYLLQSVLTGLCADIANQSVEPGAKVVQWNKTGGNNQLWLPEQVGNGVIKIRSCHEKSMFLCIQNQSFDDGGRLQIYHEENPSMYWKVQGKFPSSSW